MGMLRLLDSQCLQWSRRALGCTSGVPTLTPGCILDATLHPAMQLKVVVILLGSVALHQNWLMPPWIPAQASSQFGNLP